MFDRKKYNKEVFEDTMEMIKNDKILQTAVTKSKLKQKVILENDDIENYQDDGLIKPGRIFVTKNTSFNAARNYEGRTTVLNFASATTPGGGVLKGSSAQEECLCRCSTLYPALIEDDLNEKFYEPHRKEQNALHNNDIIVTPKVVIFKTDEYFPIPKNDWRIVNVITCAAPNLRKENNEFNIDKPLEEKISDTELYNIHVKRAKRILDVALRIGTDDIILGAFGCGAFRNNPEIVAKAYRDVLEDYRKKFDNIEFAVYCNPTNTENFDVFKRIIGDYFDGKKE